MISIGAWNDFHGSMELSICPRNYCYAGPWNDFHGYMEVFPSVNGKVSLGHTIVNKILLE
jgi:hypothetical protein